MVKHQIGNHFPPPIGVLHPQAGNPPPAFLEFKLTRFLRSCRSGLNSKFFRLPFRCRDVSYTTFWFRVEETARFHSTQRGCWATTRAGLGGGCCCQATTRARLGTEPLVQVTCFGVTRLGGSVNGGWRFGAQLGSWIVFHHGRKLKNHHKQANNYVDIIMVINKLHKSI